MVQATNRRYLRHIYQLLLSGQQVRQIDLALTLGYARSSISIAIKQLREEHLVMIENNHIFLTKQGEKLADESLLLYQQIYQWIIDSGLSDYEATRYADKLECDFDRRFINLFIKKD